MSEKGRYEVIALSAEQAAENWPECRRLLYGAIEMSDGRWQLEQVYHAVVTDRQVVLMIRKDGWNVAACTIERVVYPEQVNLAVHFLGGLGYEGWYPDLMECLKFFARTWGCEHIETNARHGFWKLFKETGWTRPSAFYQFKVEPE